MSTDSAVAAYPAEDVQERRTLLLGTRLMLAANSTLMIAMIFAYLYLRSQNYNGMWRPSGIADLSSPLMAVILILQLVSLVVVVAAIGASARGTSVRSLTGVALVLALAAGVLRVVYQYSLGSGWVITNGTYTAVSEMWLGIFIVESLLGCVWLLSLVIPGERSITPAYTARHLRAFAEFWGYLLVVTTLFWLLIRLV